MGAVNDDEHFGRKVSATAVKQDARHLDIGDLVRMLRAKKMESCQPMLAVDDQVLAFRLAQMPDRLRLPCTLEPQRLVREDQNRPGNHGLSDDGLVKIDNLLDLLPVQLTLKAFFASLNAGNELRHIIMFGDFP